MDYYEGMVEKYIAADRKTFISPQFYLKLGAELWVDAVAIDTKEQRFYFCEVTFSKAVNKICQKALGYIENESAIRDSICELANIPLHWQFRPWLFLLRDSAQKLANRWSHAVHPKITYLEYTAPWFYSNGFRTDEPNKPYPDLDPSFQ